MDKKIVIVGICVCSFFVSFIEVDSIIATDDTKKTTFKLLENPNSLSVNAEDLFFGSHELSKEDLIVEAQESMAVSITELSGKRPGWTLKVNLDSFKSDQESINNAELFFPVVDPKSEIQEPFQAFKPHVYDEDSSFLDGQTGKIVHVDSGSVKLAEAEAGKGFGKWVLPYEDDKKIQLRVPTGQKEGIYLAELIYTIEEGPIP